MPLRRFLPVAFLLASLASIRAETFGAPGFQFTLDFVTVGNPGNANDAGAGGGSYAGPYGGVGYTFRMADREVSQNDIVQATASGLANVIAGPHTADRPAANVTWYEAAAFVNWLNTSTGHQAAYNLTFSGSWSMALWSSGDAWQLDGENRFRHKDAYYFLPSEDEWYKAAYHQNNGVTADYWDYATASNTIPTAVADGTTGNVAVYGGQTGPASTQLAGGLSAYGTRGQSGNVHEWMESGFDGVNNLATEDRTVRGGAWNAPEDTLRSSTYRGSVETTSSGGDIGFRVASVPEPSTAVLAIGAGLLLLARRRR